MYHYKRIRDLREDKDLSQKEVAEYLKDSQQHYQLYESGKREVPLWVALELAKLYNVSIDYIAGITDNKGGLNERKVIEEIEEKELIDKWRMLTEREKGRILERIEILTFNI